MPAVPDVLGKVPSVSAAKVFGAFPTLLLEIIRQIGLQLPSSVKEPGAHGSRVAVHNFPDFVVRHSLYIVQRHDKPVSLRQFLQGFVQFILQLFELDVSSRSVLGDKLPANAATFVGGIAFVQTQVSELPASLFKEVDRFVDRNAINPGIEGSVSFEGFQCFVGFDEGFLREVVGILPVEGHVVNGGVNTGLVTPNEFVKGGEIALARFLEKGFLRIRRAFAKCLRFDGGGQGGGWHQSEYSLGKIFGEISPTFHSKKSDRLYSAAIEGNPPTASSRERAPSNIARTTSAHFSRT